MAGCSASLPETHIIIHTLTHTHIHHHHHHPHLYCPSLTFTSHPMQTHTHVHTHSYTVIFSPHWCHYGSHPQSCIHLSIIIITAAAFIIPIIIHHPLPLYSRYPSFLHHCIHYHHFHLRKQWSSLLRTVLVLRGSIPQAAVKSPSVPLHAAASFISAASWEQRQRHRS